MWAHLARPVEPYTFRRAQLVPLLGGLEAKDHASVASALREAGDTFFRLMDGDQGLSDGLLGKNDIFADELLGALEHADELLWQHEDTRDLAVTARALHDHLGTWIALNGLHVLLRRGHDSHGCPTLEVEPGAWPPNPADFAEGEDAPIPGFDTPTADR
ncbi:MAG: hypothetical protein H6740_14885 [Alphaproteobacteria bacterium]|nr:hypothetical protein [Alphaproteobacteria bacterium]